MFAMKINFIETIFILNLIKIRNKFFSLIENNHTILILTFLFHFKLYTYLCCLLIKTKSYLFKIEKSEKFNFKKLNFI